MDSNDPTNPNSNLPLGTNPLQTPSVDPNSNLGAPLPTISQTSSPISFIPQPLPDANIGSPLPSFATTAPEIPLPNGAPAVQANSWDQPPSQPIANPWDALAQVPPQEAVPANPLSSTPEVEASASTQSPWPSSTTISTTAADVPTAPTPPDVSNPFLQPQAGANFSIPQPPIDQSLPQTPISSPVTEAPPVPNPTVTIPDPMNTAFNPAGAAAPNPFASLQPPTDPQSLGLPANGTQTPPAPVATDPWVQPAAPSLENLTPPAQEATTMGFIPTTPENPVLETGQPGSEPVENVAIQDQAIPSSPQSAPLDLSALQNNPSDGNVNDVSSPPSLDLNAQPGNPAPTQPIAPQGMMPTENAPTDLSHLIAGEDQPAQPMGNIYAPPVASDQTPGAATLQTPSTEGGSTPPPEKHLNLTKVLLVAGIPIILVVAALSAYLILGVGKSAPEADTSLPVEQSEQTQAPLTNPPDQIVAPSPAQLAEPLPAAVTPFPSVTDASLPAEPIATPAAASPTSAMDKLKARQSAAPSPTPAASSSNSLPTN